MGEGAASACVLDNEESANVERHASIDELYSKATLFVCVCFPLKACFGDMYFGLGNFSHGVCYLITREIVLCRMSAVSNALKPGTRKYFGRQHCNVYNLRSVSLRSAFYYCQLAISIMHDRA